MKKLTQQERDFIDQWYRDQGLTPPRWDAKPKRRRKMTPDEELDAFVRSGVRMIAEHFKRMGWEYGPQSPKA